VTLSALLHRDCDGFRCCDGGMFMLRAISRKPIPEAWAVFICSQRSDEILLRTDRFAIGRCPFSCWFMFN